MTMQNDRPPRQGAMVNEWYDLFSRGARDWLRHNEKVREAVRDRLPEILSSSDILGNHGDRSVRVPVKFLEHYRFRLRADEQEEGAGQGEGKPGDVAQGPQSPQKGDGEKGDGGDDEGGVEFEVELRIDDIVDWLWEELELPNLRRKEGTLEQEDYRREGWNRRGVRSRLDKRRSMKEAIKRRNIQKGGPPFSDEDLRYWQLTERKRPSTEAVVFFALDVSASMAENERQLAKTLFFWITQGLKRQYSNIKLVFIAHTTSAWEFPEEQFFQVKGTGGTHVSTAFAKALEIIEERFDPGRYNIYFFYASDGQNFPHDNDRAETLLYQLSAITNFSAYAETVVAQGVNPDSSIAYMFRIAREDGLPTDVYPLSEGKSVYDAIRKFFLHQEQEDA